MGLLQRDWELGQNLGTLVSPTFIVNNRGILLGVDAHKLRGGVSSFYSQFTSNLHTL